MRLGPFPLGMNNRASDHALPEGTVRNAVNVDFDNAGKGRRRKGMTKVYSSIKPRGGFSCPIGSFFVENMKLKRFESNNTATTLYTGIVGTEYAYDYSNDTVYFSDGIVNLKITSTSVTKWGIEPPETPTLLGTSGTLSGGVYLCAYSLVDDNGVESGASSIASIAVSDNAGIVFSNLPVSNDDQAVALRIYLSTANGSELYHIADTTSSSYTISAGRYDEGNVLELMHVSPPPPGRIIRTYNGRKYVADSLGNAWYSEQFSFDHFRLGNSYEMFPQVLTVMEPVTGGIFFATDKETWFYAGNPEDGFSITKKFDYGGIYGTGRKVPNSGDVTWQSQRGMVIGHPDGSCENVQEKNVATESAEYGSSLIREQDGIRQFIASIHAPTTSRMAATSWIDAEVIRRGE